MSKKESNKYFKGQKVSNFQIIELDFLKKDKRLYSLVKCLLCNQTKSILTFLIKRQNSCGCKNHKKKTYSKIKAFKIYQKQAKSRGYEFHIDYNDFCYLTDQNCFYCNKEPSTLINTDCKNKYKNLNNLRNGIDRLDNNVGYTKDNSVPCCIICNRGKNALSKEEWFEYLNNLVNFRKNI